MTRVRTWLASRSARIVLSVLAVAALAVGAIAVAWMTPGQAVAASPRAIATIATLTAVGAAILGVARYGGEGYLAALWIFAPLAPVVAAAVSVATYLLIPDNGADVPLQPADAVAVGLSTAIASWFLSGFPGATLACRDRAQMRAYNDLVQRYGVLAARARTERARLGDEAANALLEADACLAYVEAELHGVTCGGPALRWALSSGYTGLARLLHRAEEALIAVESPASLVGDALHDDLSLEDSGLRNRFALRRVIRDALPVLSPGAEGSLLRPVPALPKGSTVVTAAEAVAADAQADQKGSRAGTHSLTEQEAREALREVRFAINDYRDDIMDSFARGRNRLLWTYLAVSISTYVLLGLGLLFGIPKVTLVSVSVLYLVASLVGLFNRLRIESSYTPRVDDYGLYIARLLTGPLLSGLAGVAGVYLIAQTPSFLGPLAAQQTTTATVTASPLPSASPVATTVDVIQVAAPKALAEVYDLTANQLAILVAAIFGLAPLLTTQPQVASMRPRVSGEIHRRQCRRSTTRTSGRARRMIARARGARPDVAAPHPGAYHRPTPLRRGGERHRRSWFRHRVGRVATQVRFLLIPLVTPDRRRRSGPAAPQGFGPSAAGSWSGVTGTRVGEPPWTSSSRSSRWSRSWRSSWPPCASSSGSRSCTTTSAASATGAAAWPAWSTPGPTSASAGSQRSRCSTCGPRSSWSRARRC
jgi:hypothetical protein